MTDILSRIDDTATCCGHEDCDLHRFLREEMRDPAFRRAWQRLHWRERRARSGRTESTRARLRRMHHLYRSRRRKW